MVHCAASGQSDLTHEAPQLGGSGSLNRGGVGNGTSAGATLAVAPSVDTGSSSSASAAPTRTVQETDLYAVEGNRLYYLNSYRGLMVFDITNPDAPARARSRGDLYIFRRT